MEIPYAAIGPGGMAFAPAGPDRATARRRNHRKAAWWMCDRGIRGFKLLRLGGSAFDGFVRDQYTTLPDIRNRPLHMWLDLDWRYGDAEAAFAGGTAARVRSLVHEVFHGFESGSIQQVIYQIGTRMLRRLAGGQRGAPRSQQPHLGHESRSTASNSACTPMRGRPTAAGPDAARDNDGAPFHSRARHGARPARAPA